MTKVIKETASMTTREGVRLDADIYRPNSSGEFPVLLMRQPYGRAIASTVVYAHPSWYAAHGYLVVIQDVRGRGTSTGEFELFAREIEDGEDSVNWAAQLPGSTGVVGMYGFSYQGMTQLYAAVNQPPALKVIAPAMIAYNLYRDWAYENGAFCFQANLGWAVQLAAETARLKQDVKAYELLYQASRNLPLYNHSSIFTETLRKYAPSNFYYQWLNHPDPADDYWQKLSPQNLLQNSDLPMLHIGGWFDLHLRGNLSLYLDMAKRSQYRQNLIIGPWGHLPWGRKLGATNYGTEADSPVDQLQIAWFDYFLKGIDSQRLHNPPVYLFEMGSNQWKYFAEFPTNNQKSYYLSSNGLAAIRSDAGKLTAHELPPEPSEDVFVHDPWRPVPALGGHASIPSGSFERSALDCRTDILTYTSEPLLEDLYLAGQISVSLFVDSDAESFDLCAVLSGVYGYGEVYNFTQGYKKINNHDLNQPVEIPLQATCIKLFKRTCLRLSLSGACFPAYEVNPGKIVVGQASIMDFKIITVKVNCGGDYPSYVKLS